MIRPGEADRFAGKHIGAPFRIIRIGKSKTDLKPTTSIPLVGNVQRMEPS
jgi:hypothetical protein